MLTSTLQFDTLDVEHRHTVYYESHRTVESHRKFVFDHSHKRLRPHLHIFACLAILILNSQSTFNCNCYQEPDWLFKIRIVNMQNYVGINYFADLRMTLRQNFFLQDWFRNKFGGALGWG